MQGGIEMKYNFLSLENEKTKINDGTAGMIDESLFLEEYPSEVQAHEFGARVLLNGEEYQSVYTEIGALLIKSKYIEIATDNSEIQGQIGFYIRKHGRIPFVAIKKGFALLAVIVPVYTWGDDDKILDDYRKLCAMLELTRANLGGNEG